MLRGNNGGFRADSARCLGSVGSTLLAEMEAKYEMVQGLLQGGTNRPYHYRASELASLWKSRWNNHSEITMILDDVGGMVASFTSFTFVYTHQRDRRILQHILVLNMLR